MLEKHHDEGIEVHHPQNFVMRVACLRAAALAPPRGRSRSPRRPVLPARAAFGNGKDVGKRLKDETVGGAVGGAVLGGSVMLELAVPILGALTATPGQVDAQAGMAFFMIGAVHVALMVLVLKVAGAMVAGWSVFGLVPEREDKSAPAQAALSRNTFF